MEEKELLQQLDSIIQEKDEMLIPDNIRINRTIFGVEGTYVGSGDTTDATAIESDILDGKTAYLAEGKATGTMPNNGEINYMPNLEVQTIPAGYTSGGIVDTIENSDDYLECLAITEDILE